MVRNLPEVPMPVLPRWLADGLAALRARDVDAYMKIYTPDAVHEIPFTREGTVRRMEGREAIAAYMRRLPDNLRFGTLDVVSAREVGDELIIEADGHHQRLGEDGATPFD